MLNQLSEVGCLSVFIAALQDDCDVEVSKKAVIIIKKFADMLKQYNITTEVLTSATSDCSMSVESEKGNGFLYNCQFSQNNSISLLNNCNSNRSGFDSCYNTQISEDSHWTDDHLIRQNSVSSKLNQDLIIDEIMNTQDLKLLENLYISTDKPSNNSVEIKKRRMLNPEEFLTVIYGSFEDQANQNTRGIQHNDSFDSLLDDILREYEPTELNSMECY